MLTIFVDVSGDRWRDKTFDIGSSYANFVTGLFKEKKEGKRKHLDLKVYRTCRD